MRVRGLTALAIAFAIALAFTASSSFAAPATELIRIPGNVGFAEAAATQIAFGTAWHMLINRGELRPGETVRATLTVTGSATILANGGTAPVYAISPLSTKHTFRSMQSTAS